MAFILNLCTDFSSSQDRRAGNAGLSGLIKAFRGTRRDPEPRAQQPAIGPAYEHVDVLSYGPSIRAVPGCAAKFSAPGRQANSRLSGRGIVVRTG